MVTGRLPVLRRLVLPGVLPGVLLALASCGDYAHRNPYDPDTKVTISIAGPDSSFAIFETIAFTATVQPVGRGVEVFWYSDNNALLGPRGSGRFQQSGLGTTWVVARVGPHEARHPVTLVQRAARVTFTCFLSPCVRFGVSGGLARFDVVQRDLYGTPLAAGQPRGTVTFASRDPAVAEIATVADDHVIVRSVANGATWVTATIGEWTDSVRVETAIP